MFGRVAKAIPPDGQVLLITCNLTKPEATFDQIRKAYKDLLPTDAALLATALVESGHFAAAIHDEVAYEWGLKDYDALTKSIAREVTQVQEAIEPEKTKKAAKLVEDESVTLVVKLKPSQQAGEQVLSAREDLKTLLSDMITEGVEFHFAQTDIRWQWTLERVNWATLSGGELRRRVKFRAEFEGLYAGSELGPGGKKKAGKK